MSYLIISFSHKNTDLFMREKLAFPNENDKNIFLKNILKNDNISEIILLSTCNRVEIIMSVFNIKEATKNIIKELSYHSDLNYDKLYDRADIYENDSAIHHIFAVASSLNSLVIGETQIIGQLKDAFRFSLENKYCEKELSRVLHYSFKCSASVRTATSLGTGSVSVASTVVNQAKEIIKDTKGVKVLVVGAGEMSELTIKHLLSSGFDVILINRNKAKAQKLANSFEEHIDVRDYSELKTLLDNVSVMIIATSAPYPIITKDMVSLCTFNRYWFDICVPRNIEEINLLNLEVFYVDDLQDIVNNNMSLRSQQAKKAFFIVKQMSFEFFELLKSLEIEPVIKHIYTRGNKIIDKKVNIAIKKGFIKADEQDNIKKLCQSILAEYLHEPSKVVKEISKQQECGFVSKTIQSIFGLKNTINHDSDFNCDHTK